MGGKQNEYVLISLVKTRNLGHIRDIRRLTVALSRARLGLYIFGRANLFINSMELQPAFQNLMKHSTSLALLPKEKWGESHRRLEDTIPSPHYVPNLAFLTKLLISMK